MDPRVMVQRMHGQMQANAQQLQDYGRELHAWEAAMHRKDEALRQRKLRRQRGEEDESDVREQGNAHYRAGEFEAALACYTRAIALTDGRNVLVLSNRAMVHLKLERYHAAIEDASAALALDKVHVKSLQRRAKAYVNLGMHHAALRDIDTALGYQPDHKELRAECKQLQAKMAKLAPIEVLSSKEDEGEEEETKTED